MSMEGRAHAHTLTRFLLCDRLAQGVRALNILGNVIPVAISACSKYKFTGPCQHRYNALIGHIYMV